MKKNLLVLGFVCLFAAVIPKWAKAQVNVGVQFGANGLDAFHVAIGNYFKVPPPQMETVQDGNIPDEEHPVVFFIAQRANVPPEAVILLRSRGWSWMQIALHFRLNPRIFYTPGTYAGTPYENGYRSFHGRGKIRLSDTDIVNFVNLKFMSEHYGRDPHEIAQMRGEGRNFRDINDGFAQKRETVEWDAKEEPRHGRRQGLQDNQNRRDDHPGDRDHSSVQPDLNHRDQAQPDNRDPRDGKDNPDRHHRDDNP